MWWVAQEGAQKSPPVERRAAYEAKIAAKCFITTLRFLASSSLIRTGQEDT